MNGERPPRLTGFDLAPGDVLGDKYRVVERLGGGWEGEVYRAREIATGVERSVKIFFPHRDPRGRAWQGYARKLHKLRRCPILVRYHTQERLDHEGWTLRLLVSEYVEGELLSAFLRRQPGRRLDPFQGLHLLYALAKGIEPIHRMREYHGDLHDENVLVSRQGLAFEVKLLDMNNRGRPTAAAFQDDLCDLVRLFYDAVGGRRRYRTQPPEVKRICRGLKRTLIIRRFRSVRHLREHLENLEWDTC